MAKVTKSMLIKENEALKNKITELESNIKQLKKEKFELKVKLEYLENLPKQVYDGIGGTINGLVSVLNPQHQTQK